MYDQQIYLWTNAIIVDTWDEWMYYRSHVSIANQMAFGWLLTYVAWALAATSPARAQSPARPPSGRARSAWRWAETAWSTCRLWSTLSRRRRGRCCATPSRTVCCSRTWRSRCLRRSSEACSNKPPRWVPPCPPPLAPGPSTPYSLFAPPHPHIPQNPVSISLNPLTLL